LRFLALRAVIHAFLTSEVSVAVLGHIVMGFCNGYPFGGDSSWPCRLKPLSLLVDSILLNGCGIGLWA
jgi:hypothetical protein